MKLNLQSILKAALAVATPLASAHPLGAAALAAINAFLPESEQVSANATGRDVMDKIGALPAAQQQLLLSQQIEAEVEVERIFAGSVQAMAEVDKAGASTRPYIAKLMAWYFVVSGILLAVALCLAVEEGEATLRAVSDLWLIVLTWMALPAALLRSYFGLRTDEKNARYAAAVGQNLPVRGSLSALINRIGSK
jgi:hypothetical protein